MAQRDLPLAVYVDKDTIIHRIPAGLKLLGVLAFVLFTTLAISTPLGGLFACGAMLIGYALAQIPPRIILSQIWPPLVILIPLCLFQWWSKTGEFALTLFLTLFAAMLSSFLLTLTSTVDEIMDGVETGLRPLERLGLPVETISLTVSLTLRLIPLMFGTVDEVLKARKARGAGFSLQAFGTPVIIRSLRRARAIGEALQARGVGD
ncbi:MAG: energy-coupling factor transporter transmembrane protein EcfT [Corynebacterium sp.]|nr:energy-coupling factor transporter transmembrane protein EcfT [Corynebacterium sp.]